MTRRHAKAKAKFPVPQKVRMGGDLFVHPNAATFTGKVDKSVNARLAALPFVRSRKRGEKGGRCWWSVTSSGKYAEDYNQGRVWARLVLPLLKYNVGAPLLSWIVADMIDAGERNGLVLGFVREVGDQLKVTRGNLAIAVVATDPKVSPDIRKIWRNGRSRLGAEMAAAL